MSHTVYVLGGSQTDFALNAARQGLGLFELMSDAVLRALDNSDLTASEIQSGHVGNFVGELFTGQG
ncbi:MAG: thiolase domain-containing protein, partial [Burkholderiaceae bacterium]|nr:thiolase domain-containing protein [Burkholderiaceae bacterium]